MVTIVIDPLLSSSVVYEHICLGNIKKLYKSSRKCDYQQKYKAIIEAAMFSTPDVFTVNSPL